MKKTGLQRKICCKQQHKATQQQQLNCLSKLHDYLLQMEMKVMLTKFFQHCTLHLADTEQYELGMRATLFPYSELQCTVCQRTD